jgi:uncharacterized protein YkwD
MHKKLLLVAFLVLGINLLANENSIQLENKTNDAVFKTEMLKLVNQIRSEGCRCGRRRMPPAPPLQWNNKLENAAKAHAKDMNYNKFFGHRGSDGSKIGERITAANYYWRAVGENVSWGYRTVERAVLGWKDSPSHCMTLMSPDYKEMGAANEGKFWVQEFGRKMD